MRITQKMTERPILFSGEMVRAILDGRKRQTRRILSRQPDDRDQDVKIENGWVMFRRAGVGWCRDQKCRYGMPGDRLWVKEKHCFLDVTKSSEPKRWNLEVEYSDGSERPNHTYNGKPKQTRERGDIGWRPSIHMPRWASRLTLKVDEIGVERLQDISDAGAIAEGITPHPKGLWLPCREKGKAHIEPRLAYRDLWESIHGVGSWAANPWVWVVWFKPLP